MKHIFYFIILAVFLFTLPSISGKAFKVKEQVERRTISSKTYQTGENCFKTVIYNKPVHYKSSSGAWQDIDLQLNPHSDGYANLTNTLKPVFSANRIAIDGKEKGIVMDGFSAVHSSESKTLMTSVSTAKKSELKYLSQDGIETLQVQVFNNSMRLSIDLGKIEVPCQVNFNMSLPAKYTYRFTENYLQIVDESGNAKYTLSRPLLSDSDKISKLPEFLISSTGKIIEVTIPVESGTGNLFLELLGHNNVPSQLVEGGVFKEYVNGSYSFMSTDFFPFVGRYTINDTTYDNYKCYHYYDLSAITDNAVIDSAQYKVSKGNSTASISVSMYQMSYQWPGSATNLWNDCSNGNNYGSFDTGDDNPLFDDTLSSYDDFCQDIESQLSSDWFGVGFDGSSSEGYAELRSYQVNGDLTIYYHDPYERFEVAVTNSFGSGIFLMEFMGQTLQYTAPDTFTFFHGDYIRLEAQNQQSGNYFRVFRDWKKDGDFQSSGISIGHTVIGDVGFEAVFKKRYEISFENTFLEGGSGGEIIVNDTSITSPQLRYTLEGSGAVFNVEAIPNQTIEINGNNIQHHFLNYSDRDVINWGNQMPFPELERTYTPQDNEDIDLLFKAHIHTDSPQNADTKNQRQLLNLGDTWIMVYESNGDIWLTASDDAGITWCKEERMNIRQAHGYNPSISNVFNFGSSYDYYAITWLEENASEEIELHLQTMRASGDWIFYGWKGGDYYGRVDGVNHRMFDWNGYGDLRSGARPVLRLDLSVTDILMTAAGEVEGSGIHMSHIKFEGNGYNSVEDLDDASVIKYGFNPSPPAGSLGFCRRVSTSTKHKYPVIINTPPSYGGTAKNYIYFAEDNSYLPKLKLHDITANTTSTISIPSEFSRIFSLQGGSSPGNATFALCVRTSAYIGGPNVIVLERPSYGGTPQLKTVYRGYNHPTIMVDQQSGFNSSGCVHTVMMQGNDENWYWADGGEIDYLDSEIAGIFSREKVNSNDQEVMIVRDGEVPTIIEKLGGEKKLAKGVLSTTNIRYFRYWDDNKSKLNLSVLDFHGATVQLFDSTKSSSKITAIKLLEAGKNGFIV